LRRSDIAAQHLHHIISWLQVLQTEQNSVILRT
jgi:hypothetical protein